MEASRAGARDRLDLRKVLADLATERPMCHSEADFLLALAWLIPRQRPDAVVRLEYKAPLGGGRRLDLWVDDDGDRLAVELKYFTQRLVATHRGEAYDLVNQSAAPIGRYHFVSDMARVEVAAAADPTVRGAAIALTNNPAYWRASREPLGTSDHAFRIHEEQVLRGTVGWATMTGIGALRGISGPITLRGEYTLSWATTRWCQTGRAVGSATCSWRPTAERDPPTHVGCSP